jgi:selenide,water dikinase
VHALTDVTGFGLLGHLLEICRGSKLQATLDFAKLPILSAAKFLAEQGYVTGASDRNWASYGPHVTMPAGAPGWQQKMLTDPQTSGGLLVACDAATAPQVLEIFHQQGFKDACVIGEMRAGSAKIVVS